MRATLTIDDQLFSQARELAEPGLDAAGLLREAVKTFVQVRAAERLAALGGQAPHMVAAPRRQPVRSAQTAHAPPT